MHAYSLTHLTGRRRNADRTIVVATVEMNRFTFTVVILSIAASILPAIVVGLLLGENGAFALIISALFVVVGLALVDQRMKKGLRLRRYEAMWDSRKAKSAAATIYVCSEPLAKPELATLIHTSVPLPVSSTGGGTVISPRVERGQTPKVGVFE